MQVIPAILTTTLDDVKEKLSRVDGVASLVQIDVCDGTVGRGQTWLPEGNEELPTGIHYEFDLMVADWRKYVEKTLTLGTQRIVLHMDAFTDDECNDAIERLKQYNCKLIIATSNDTPIDTHINLINLCKSQYPNIGAQVMGIKSIGEQGQEFDESCIARIKTIKASFGDIELQVDGGINFETAKKVIEAGADSIISGSLIFGQEDAGGMIGQLQSIAS